MFPKKTLLVHIKWIMEYYVRNTARKDFPICIFASLYLLRIQIRD